jgi:hypothetical protein
MTFFVTVGICRKHRDNSTVSSAVTTRRGAHNEFYVVQINRFQFNSNFVVPLATTRSSDH